jgi:serine/threonine protein kinase/tetratricopeptide (TPR) repeat protein
MEQLGRYRLNARIATGGMAEVYLARAEGVQGFSRTVVIKRLLPHLTRDPAVVEMFLNEAKLTGRLDHPNVVQVLDLGEDRGAYYIAMEFLDGRALSEVRDAARLQGGMLPTPFTLKVFSEALAGLHHAHEAKAEDGRPLQIVHRDFNPDNIVVTYDGRVKVVDFGIAKAQVAASSTEPGTLKGKYYYMSPEMVLGTPLDRRADLFAVGVSLYELLCDKRPFEGDTPNAILSGIAYGKAVGPRQINPSLSPELEALITHCLERAPDSRPPTALAIKEDLDRLLTHEAKFGQAEMAQVMELLFPAGKDAERQRIGELRQLDPSHPSVPALSVRPPMETAPAPGTTSAERLRRPELKLPEPSRPAVPAKPQRPAVLPMALAGVLLLGVGVVAAWRYLPHLVPHRAPDPAEAQFEALETELSSHPEDPQLRLRYAEALLQKGQAGKAEAQVDQLLTKNPDLARAHALKGDFLQQRRQGQKALAEYQRALELRPDDVTTWQHLADLQEARGELGGAREALQKALGLKPNDRALALKLSDLLGRTGDWDKAVELLGPLAGRHPQDADVRAALGLALFQKGDLPRAQSELLAAERLAPTASRTQYYLGLLYYRKDQAQKAIESFKAAIAHAPSPQEAAQAHAALGQVFLDKGDRDGAKAEFAAAVAGDKTLVDAQHQLQKLQ